MIILNKSSLSFLIIFIFTVVFSACSTINDSIRSQDIYKDSEAYNILEILRNTNATLNNFKGIGTTKSFQPGGSSQIFRIAWLGASHQRKIRMEILGVSGQPAASMASDGSYFYFLSRNTRRFYKKRLSKNTTLKQIISIPVKPSDILDLLAGRIPVYEHYIATIEHAASGEYVVLILKNRRHEVVERIYVDKSKTAAYKVEKFDRSGSLMYRAAFSRMQDINGYQVPLELEISTDQGVFFSLTVDRFWTEASASPEMFVLTPAIQ